VEALSKKFFPEDKYKNDENMDSADLLRTIRISRNLFSLTERLPKNKYRGRSNELHRNHSVDSNINRIPAAQAIANNNVHKMMNFGQGGSQLDLELESPDKGSRQSGSRPKINPDSEEELPEIVKKGNISKPKAASIGQSNRTPGQEKEAKLGKQRNASNLIPPINGGQPQEDGWDDDT